MTASVGVIEKEKESKNHNSFGILMYKEKKGIESSYHAPNQCGPSLCLSLNALR